MAVLKRGTSVVCVLLVVATFAAGVTGAQGELRTAATFVRVHRISGATRFETGAMVSSYGWTSAATVVVATGRSFPDALAGAPLAAALGGPLLLSDTTSLPSAAADEIERLGATRVVLLGGTSALSDAVKTACGSIVGAGNVERISGADRYETAKKIAERVKAELGATGGKVVVATGLAFPDALSISGWAARAGYPILLTKPAEIPAYTQQALTSLGATSTIVVGGTSAVSAAVYAQLPSPTRLQGANRYETSKAIAQAAVAAGALSWVEAVIATGVNFPDALAAGPLAARLAAPTILTLTTDLHPAAQAIIDEHGEEMEQALLIGGTAALSDSVGTEIDTLIAPSPWKTPRAISSADLNATLYPHNLAGDCGPDGSMHVVWQESSTLRYRKLDRNGCTVVDRVDIATGLSTTYRDFPAVAGTADGGAVVVWRDTIDDATPAGMWACALDSAGRLRLAPRRIALVTNRFCSADIGADGLLHVVITEMDAPNRPLYGVWDAGDLGLVTPFTPLTMIGRDTHWTRVPSIVARADGAIDTAWYDRRDPLLTYASYSDVYLSRLAGGSSDVPLGVGSIDQRKVGDKNGGFFFAEDTSNTYGDSYSPGLAVDQYGATHVTWIDGDTDVYYTRIAADGSTAVPQTCVLDLPVSGATITMAPRTLVAPLPGGGAEVYYTCYYDGVGTRMGELRIAPDGSVEGTPARITPLPETVGLPLAAGWSTAPGTPRSIVFASNVATDKLYFIGKYLPSAAADTSKCDLQIDDAHSTNSSTLTPPRSGSVVHMTVPVHNTGAVASPATSCQVKYGSTLLGTLAVPALAVGASANASQDFTLPAELTSDEVYVRFIVDPGGTVSEQSESNNAVDHLITVQPRPTGKAIAIKGADETNDETHSQEWYQGVDGFSVTISGTATELGNPWSRTVTAAGDVAYLGVVPVGTYTMTASCAGYASPTPVPVTVTRDGTDEYLITVSPLDTGGLNVLWFNTWGSVSGTVRNSQGTPSTGDDTPVNGATVTVRETGATTTTNASGAYSFPRLAAGTYTLDVKAAGLAPQFARSATVTVAGNSVQDFLLDPTTEAWCDVTVTNVYGTPLPGVMVEARNASHTMLAYALTDAGGRARVHATAANVAYVYANKTLYTPQEEGPFSVTAGTVRSSAFELAMTSSVGRTSSEWGRWIVNAMHYEMKDSEWWGFWRNFHNRYDLTYRDEGLDRYVTQLDTYVAAKVFTWSCQSFAIDIDTPVGAIPELDWHVPVPYVGERANVEIEAVKLVDSLDGDVLWSSSMGDSWYSHDGVDEQNEHVYVVEDSVAGDGVLVPWPTVEVYLWVNVQQAVPGATGSDGWQSMPTGGSGKTVIVWTPSTNQMYSQPWLTDPWGS